MILQALNDYYRRKAADPDPARRLPAFGLEEKEIPFILEIDAGWPLAAADSRHAAQGGQEANRPAFPGAGRRSSARRV